MKTKTRPCNFYTLRSNLGTPQQTPARTIIMYACSDWLRHLCARKLWPNKRAHSFFAAARTRDHFRTQYIQDTDLSPRGLRKFNLSCLPLPMFQCLKTVHGSFYFLTIYFKCRRVLCAARCFRPLFVLRGLWCLSGLLRTAACHRLAANLACTPRLVAFFTFDIFVCRSSSRARAC